MGCMYFFILECQETPVVRHKSVRAVSSVCNAFISVMQFAELRNLNDGSLAQHPSRRRPTPASTLPFRSGSATRQARGTAP